MDFRSTTRWWARTGVWMGVLATCGAAALAAGFAQKGKTQPEFGFDVQVVLSPKAAARMAELKEGLQVWASYSGDPVPSAKKYTDQLGRIDLGRETIEAPGKSGTVEVTGAKVARDRLKWIAGPVLLNVNVGSAWKSGPMNILDCDFFDGDLKDAVRKQPVKLRCFLITEKVKTEALS
jgi:hypothetical protein